ncbi:MAG: hypothetical protein KDA42_10885, partial [Planctomycetales bacterium]|nr:hypothetical protein [Planctomycetales bacterium]
DVRETLYRLRRNPRTAHTPIGILAAVDDRSRAEQLAAEIGFSHVFVEPQDDKAAQYCVDTLQTLLPRDVPVGDERTSMAREALELLHVLASDATRRQEMWRYQVAIEHAARHPQLHEAAIKLLVDFGTPSSQTALVNLASLSGLAMPVRSVAAQGFAASVGRHGVLLTTKQILQQYDRYNASEAAAPETQKLLASLLDAIESPRLAEQDNPPSE